MSSSHSLFARLLQKGILSNLDQTMSSSTISDGRNEFATPDRCQHRGARSSWSELPVNAITDAGGGHSNARAAAVGVTRSPTILTVDSQMTLVATPIMSIRNPVAESAPKRTKPPTPDM